MNDKISYLTKEGLEKLRTELEFLIKVRRKEIASRIQEAKELGDLSENAEYQEAKNEQAFNEGRIEELENILKQAVIIDDQSKKNDVVRVGSHVAVEVAGQAKEYSIVGSNEADPLTGKISNESPIGQALLGHRLDEQVSVETPKGSVEYIIKKIS